jgi:hypothetical protein
MSFGSSETSSRSHVTEFGELRQWDEMTQIVQPVARHIDRKVMQMNKIADGLHDV